MHYKKNTRSEILTLDLAKEIAAMPGLPGEREIRPQRIKFLRNNLSDGNFSGPNWAIATNSKTSETFRLNGQHSSHMLAELEPDQFPVGLHVTIDVYVFDDASRDIAVLFNLFDHPRSARTDTDFMGITRAAYPEFVALENGYLVKVASGVDANLRDQIERANFTDRPALFDKLLPHRYHGEYFYHDQYREFAVWLHQWHERMHFPFITGRNGVIAEILDNWAASPAWATEFWGYVFGQNHPDPDHESHELLKELQTLANRAKKVSAPEWKKKAKKYWSRFARVCITQEGAKQPAAV